ncbi:MAG: hypothetical protein M3552_10595 [Planctomycetota bacterium]|nr:hypothetical protein [Planctomycetota bacterium]
MQVQDSLKFGGRKYVINQQPMLGYWHDNEWGSTGTKPFPKFDFVSFNNWRRYDAAWFIADGQLWLDNLSGEIQGRKVKNEEIILDYAFPARADWFTGRIELAVGDQNRHTGKYSAVIVLHIEEGKVKKMTLMESAWLVGSWNGLDDRPVEAPKPKTVSGTAKVGR